MSVVTQDIVEIVQQQQRWRRQECINLIASENVQSPAVQEIEANDFMCRYAEGHPNTAEADHRYYEGTRYIDEVEALATREMIELAGCRQADVRPISGNQANTAVALALLRGGDTVLCNSIDVGGHISHNPIGVFGRRIQVRGQVLALQKENSINMAFWPTTPDGYHLDAAACVDLVEQQKPQLVILGKSLFLFPEPVREVAEVCRTLGIPLLYDAAHVLGLILGGQFQQPFTEGAHLLTASTHKTFPGPQRGVILGNLSSPEELKWWSSVDRGVMPGSSSNHHLHTIPGLAITIREIKAHGAAYATATVRNAQALGKALDEAGISVEAKEFGFTQSHQLALNVSSFGPGKDIARRLAQSNIICNYNMLPGDQDPRNPSGLRIGVQEMTRCGMGPEEMGQLAELMRDVIAQNKSVGEAVKQLRSRFTAVQYC